MEKKQKIILGVVAGIAVVGVATAGLYFSNPAAFQGALGPGTSTPSLNSAAETAPSNLEQVAVEEEDNDPGIEAVAIDSNLTSQIPLQPVGNTSSNIACSPNNPEVNSGETMSWTMGINATNLQQEYPYLNIDQQGYSGELGSASPSNSPSFETSYPNGTGTATVTPTVILQTGPDAYVSVKGTPCSVAVKDSVAIAQINPQVLQQLQINPLTPPEPAPPVVNFLTCAPDQNPAETGSQVAWTATIDPAWLTQFQQVLDQNGMNLDSISYEWSGDQVNTLAQQTVYATYSEGTTSATVTAGATFTVDGIEHDVIGQPCNVTLEDPQPLTTINATLELACSATPAPATVGETVVWQAELVQGSDIYKSLIDWSLDVVDENTATVVKTYSTPGTYTAEVTFNEVSDPNVTLIPAQCSVTIVEDTTAAQTQAAIDAAQQAAAEAAAAAAAAEAAADAAAADAAAKIAALQAQLAAAQDAAAKAAIQAQIDALESGNTTTPSTTTQPTTTTQPSTTAQPSTTSREPVAPLSGDGPCFDGAYPNDIALHWSEDFVRYVVDQCIAAGYADGTFRPDVAVTRAEALKMTMVAAGYDEYDDCADTRCGTTFTDLSSASWAAGWIRQGWANGVAQGRTTSSFAPNATITRAEAAALIVRAFELEAPAGSAPSFVDVTASWQRPYVYSIADLHNLAQGIGNGRFDPNRSITRSELAKILALATQL